MKRYKIYTWVANITVVALSVFFIAVIVYGATTIGDNINTGGNLTVTGRASTTSATTTDYLYVGPDGTEPAGWNFSLGDLFVTDDAFFNSQATTSASLWVGSGGTSDYLDLTGGDLYVQDDVEIDGSATTTSLYLSNDLKVIGTASTTGSMYVGGGTFALATGTPTTTAGLFVGPTSGRSTTTIGIGTEKQNGCIELGRNGVYYRIFVDDATGNTLVVAAGRCKD